MKKTLTVLLVAGALLGASGCSTAPTLSNEETCARIQGVGAGPTSTADKAGMIKLANRLRPIHAAASGDLKAPLTSIIDFLDESARETPDTGKLEGLQAGYTSAGQTLGAVCGGGGGQ